MILPGSMGQRLLKRACEVAISGMHNMLMVGPPGAGKTMIAKCIPTILPPMSQEEQLEVSKIYSVCGALKGMDQLIQKRPFRSPHHTITEQGLIGGGSMVHPGEISLAHGGVLFLDELTEFKRVRWKSCVSRWRTSRYVWRASAEIIAFQRILSLWQP